MFEQDKRIQNRCPKDDCKSLFISFELNPIPGKELIYRCDVCNHRFKARREQDHNKFNGLAREFNQ